MKKMILTSFAAALMAASVAPMAVAAERHHARKVDRAPVSDQFRNANNAITSQPSPYAGYAFHGYSAPAGH